ncbi:MAG: DUF1559 domain-containing protein [Planctomycetaceae bacterium]|jgi:hypothetical protein|nr:DUF1559 domain-containing protein [Planctomycetaceae bacterium]
MTKLLTKRVVVVGLVIIFLPILVLWSGVLDAPRGHPHLTCKSNMMRLGMALDAYREDYGCFPPSFVTDENGKPMHSWRALILPYLDSDDVYPYNMPIKYNYGESWNSPHNQQFHDKRPKIFHCNYDKYNKESLRQASPTYVMITDTNNTLGNRKKAKYGTTILLIEIKKANFNWLEPKDIPLSSLQYDSYRLPPNTPVVGAYHSTSGDFFILRHDRYVTAISSKTTDIEVIKAMATIDNSEYITEKRNKYGRTFYEFIPKPVRQ